MSTKKDNLKELFNDFKINNNTETNTYAGSLSVYEVSTNDSCTAGDAGCCDTDVSHIYDQAFDFSFDLTDHRQTGTGNG